VENAENRKMILFVQPFGLGSPGGGSRILRALLENAPTAWLSVAATPEPTPASPFGQEIQETGRPHFGRLERTRFAHWFNHLDGWAGSKLEKKLNQIVKRQGVTSVHAIAHVCWDTLVAFKVARQFKLPFFLTIHDDPAYCLRENPQQEKMLSGVAVCWREAEARFVISHEMGEELCRRWGKQNYILVTDGLTDIAGQPRPAHPKRMTVYFMGLMHISYEPNFVALQKALRIISERQTELKVSFVLRCGAVRKDAIVQPEMCRVLPFGTESEVLSDLENADVVYQPLSLAPGNQAMSAYSLSTKMITYLGSGLPILFHGPPDSAAGKLLDRNNAAIVCGSNDPQQLAQALLRLIGSERDQVVSSALKLARRQFRLSEAREKFWSVINAR
jgi:glycosyltransferase involved in cell wall biosynthesis